jgi:aspartate aminotransferase
MTSRGSISQRALAVKPSATLAITNKANQMRAAGEPVIGFGAGEPDFPTPDHIVAAAIAEASLPRSHRYSAAAGQPALREAVAAKTVRDSGFVTKPSNVIITNGGKQAVYLACQALLDPGDEVLLPAPYWVTYPEAIGLAGGVTVPIKTDESTNFSVTVEQLETATTERTKMLIFVSPSNPTGAVYTPQQVQDIARWAADRGIWVMTDEIYEHLTYGDAQFASVPIMEPRIADRTVIVNGVSKTYAMTGWRVGWMIAPDEVAAGAGRIQSHLSSNVNNVAQAAALAAVAGPLDASLAMRDAFDRRRKTMVTMLRSIDGVTCTEPQGAFYAFPNMTGLLGRSFNGSTPSTTLELAALVLDEAKVAIVPGEAFGAPGYARLSFALSGDDLVAGIQRIADLVASG